MQYFNSPRNSSAPNKDRDNVKSGATWQRSSDDGGNASLRTNATPRQDAPQDMVPHDKATQVGLPTRKKTYPATVGDNPPATLCTNLKILNILPTTLMPQIQSMILMAQTITMLQARTSTTHPRTMRTTQTSRRIVMLLQQCSMAEASQPPRSRKCIPQQQSGTQQLR